jgi:hypothetical protein
MAGQLALRWGDNECFARPEPWDELVYVAANHDNGWAGWELAPRILPDGRPAGFLEMDLQEHFAIWQRGIERMSATSLYGALLISMHGTELYRRRLAEDVRGDTSAMRQSIRRFVDEQAAFQARMRRALADHPRYGPLLAAGPLGDAFRLLQIWDLLALMLLVDPLRSHTLEDAPVEPGVRTTLNVTFPDPRTLALEPYPFSEAPFTVRADGRWVRQQTFGHNTLLRRAMEEAEVVGVEFEVNKA